MFEKLKCKCDKENLTKIIAVIICFIIVITGGIVGILFSFGVFDEGFILKSRGCM